MDTVVKQYTKNMITTLVARKKPMVNFHNGRDTLHVGYEEMLASFFVGYRVISHLRFF